MNRWRARFEAVDARLATFPAWGWSAALLLLALACWATSASITPVGEQLWWFGRPLGSPCAFREAVGVPCPNCGMTRAFVWSARLEVARALAYNPGGAVLFWWITMGGAVGAGRLATGRPRWGQPPALAFAAWCAVWLLALYWGPWSARWWGWNPLP